MSRQWSGIEVWHSRPVAPTRRLALGEVGLGVSGASDVMLVAALVALAARGLSENDLARMQRLIEMVGDGERVLQPALHHRYQTDRHGLARSVAVLEVDGTSVSLQVEGTADVLQLALAGVYAIELLEESRRRQIAEAAVRALSWRGEIGRAFVLYVMLGVQTLERSEAAGILQIDPDADESEVRRRFRELVRLAHPDLGGSRDAAAGRIAELERARNVMLGL